MIATMSTEQIELERRARLQEICALAQEFGVAAAHVHVEFGGALDVLPKMTETLRADVILMGALSRRAWRRLITGSTAESVLERLPCDAMIIKPPDFASLLPI
jgi:universal stress protein E